LIHFEAVEDDYFKNMRILTVLTYYRPHWTGLTAHAVRVAEGLAARGHDVTVLTIKYHPELARDEMINGVRVVRLQPISQFSRGMITPAFPWAAWQLFSECNVVQIHSPLPEALMVALMCKLQRRPFLMTHHGDLVLPGGVFNRILQRIGDSILTNTGRMADKVTSYSQDYADHSIMLQKLKSKLEYVYPPVEIPIPNLTDSNRWKDDLGLSDKSIIGIAGRWVEEKGFDHLLRAFPLIQASIPNAHLVFAGEREVVYEDTFAHCVPLIESIQEDITFLGLIRDQQKMADFYAMCDVFALPSRTDMMALTQIEAMLCGTPVVASDIPGARVVVQETGFGQLSPPSNPERLAETIIDTLNNRETYRPSKEGVRKVFNTTRTFEQYELILSSISAQQSISFRSDPVSSREHIEPKSNGEGG
jgi:glycosyltransferase involved in cell wall biosynthesis